MNDDSTKLIFYAISALIIFSGNYLFESYKCNSISKKMQLDSSFSLITGCMIKTKSGWIKSDNYRVIN